MRGWMFLLGALLATQARAAEPVHADLLLTNATVWTVDRDRPRAEAVAIWGDRILAVGRSADLKTLAGPRTRVIDLKGQLLLPGFHDCHAHLLTSGMLLAQVGLKDAADEAEFGRRLQEFDRKLPKDRWLLGGNWDHDRAFKGELPTAALIDRYVKDRPVFLRRYDGHMGIVNTKALAMAGINAQTRDPEGGVIYRKAGSKEPTGLLRDNAMSLVTSLIPAPGADEIAEAIRAVLPEARQLGVTTVQDMDGSDSKTRAQLFRLYQQLAKDDKLTLRIDLFWPLAEWQELSKLGVRQGQGDDWVKIGGVKGFVDGSLGSSTARMFEPYVHEPNSNGVYVTPLSKLREYIQGADRAGLQVAVHAIGDRANAELLDIFDEVARKNGPRDRRFRTEHVQHLRPQEYKRFKEIGVVASLQPYHIIDDGRWAEGRIGRKRCASSYANRSLLDAGARVAFGSDWSVAPLSPLLGIDAAVHRRTLDGKHPDGWFPDQKISVTEAIEAYTLTAAYAGFHEKTRGSVSPGKLADLVVLSHNILSDGERDRIAQTEVVLTVVGGKVVHQKK